MFVKLSHPPNASSPMLVTFLPSIELGITTFPPLPLYFVISIVPSSSIEYSISKVSIFMCITSVSNLIII